MFKNKAQRNAVQSERKGGGRRKLREEGRKKERILSAEHVFVSLDPQRDLVKGEEIPG